MATEVKRKRLILAIGSVLLLFAAVTFIVNYLLRPTFVISWPELSHRADGVTVSFTAENRTDAPLSKTVRVMIVAEKETRNHGVRGHDTLGEQRMTVSLAPSEKKPVRCDFPAPERTPTQAWVELVPDGK